MRYALALLLTLLAVNCWAEKPAAKKPPTLAELAEDLDTKIEAIDRNTLTAVKADIELNKVLSAYNRRRDAMTMTYEITDITTSGFRPGIHVLPNQDGLTTPEVFTTPRGFVNPAMVDKGDILTISGTLQAVYLTGKVSSKDGICIGTSRAAKWYLSRFKFTITKPAKPKMEK